MRAKRVYKEFADGRRELYATFSKATDAEEFVTKRNSEIPAEVGWKYTSEAYLQEGTKGKIDTILAYIRKNPGCTFAEIVSGCDFPSSSTVARILSLLVKEGRLIVIDEKGRGRRKGKEIVHTYYYLYHDGSRGQSASVTKYEVTE